MSREFDNAYKSACLRLQVVVLIDMYDKFAVMSTQKVEEEGILALLSRTCLFCMVGRTR